MTQLTKFLQAVRARVAKANQEQPSVDAALKLRDELYADVARLLALAEAGEVVAKAADKIAQARIEPFSSWGLVQDLRDELTAYTAACREATKDE